MKEGPSRAAQILLQRFPLDAPPRTLLDCVSDICIAEGWVQDSAEAREKAERWQPKILAYLRKELSDLQAIGRPVRLAFNSSSDYMIQGVAFVEPHDSPTLQDSKRKRARYSDYYPALIGITPAQFEILCGNLIQLLGVRDAVVTRGSADEGIDFYGKLPLGSMVFPEDFSQTVQKQLEIWLVGQAKHYQAIQSGTPELRELVGSITLGRAGAFGSTKPALDRMSIRVADPVISIFMTTGSISSNGWQLLKRSGVVGMDGEMIAAFLADRGIGLDQDTFDTNVFLGWLDD